VVAVVTPVVFGRGRDDCPPDDPSRLEGKTEGKVSFVLLP
jgi:hypothetical protein